MNDQNLLQKPDKPSRFDKRTLMFAASALFIFGGFLVVAAVMLALNEFGVMG